MNTILRVLRCYFASQGFPHQSKCSRDDAGKGRQIDAFTFLKERCVGSIKYASEASNFGSCYMQVF